jgi:hypothetical protein
MLLHSSHKETKDRADSFKSVRIMTRTDRLTGYACDSSMGLTMSHFNLLNPPTTTQSTAAAASSYAIHLTLNHPSR